MRTASFFSDRRFAHGLAVHLLQTPELVLILLSLLYRVRSPRVVHATLGIVHLALNL